MPLYNVEISTMMVVVAVDEHDAISVAASFANEAIRDATPDCLIFGEINSFEDLRDGWDTDCVAYGGDGNTRIGYYLER